MKILTIGKRWIVLDKNQTVEFECGEYAFAYAFMVSKTRTQALTPKSIFPIRSMVPQQMIMLLNKESQ